MALKKDGTPKQTKNNTKINREDVQPFKEFDVPLIKQYFMDRINDSKNLDDELTNRRNYTLFVMGVNIGLRCNELIALRWNDIYDNEWNFLDDKKFKYNDAFKQVIEEYREYKKYSGEISNINSYIFRSRENGHDHISVDTLGQIIKKAAKSKGIKYNVNTLSLRKTFVYQQIHDNKMDLYTLQELVGKDLFINVLRYLN